MPLIPAPERKKQADFCELRAAWSTKEVQGQTQLLQRETPISKNQKWKKKEIEKEKQRHMLHKKIIKGWDDPEACWKSAT